MCIGAPGTIITVNNVEQIVPASGFVILKNFAAVTGSVRVIEFANPDAVATSVVGATDLIAKTDVGIGLDLLSLFVNLSNGNSAKAQSSAVNLFRN